MLAPLRMIFFGLTLVALTSVMSGTAKSDGQVVDESAIQDFVKSLSGFRLEDIKDRKDYSSIYDFLEQGRRAVHSPQGIKLFREQDNLDIVRKLVEFTTVPDRGVRISSSLTLADIIDNTTICVIIDKLFSKELNDDTRFNLLQITNIVAPFAFSENRLWIQAAVKKNGELIEGQPGFEQTKKLLNLVEDSLNNSNSDAKTILLRDKFPKEFEACKQLEQIKALSP
jgi:hypothetical protein